MDHYKGFSIILRCFHVGSPSSDGFYRLVRCWTAVETYLVGKPIVGLVGIFIGSGHNRPLGVSLWVFVLFDDSRHPLVGPRPLPSLLSKIEFVCPRSGLFRPPSVCGSLVSSQYEPYNIQNTFNPNVSPFSLIRVILYDS